METQELNNEYSKKHIDPLKIMAGSSLGSDGNLYDENGKFIGPVPTKEYASFQEWNKEVNERTEILDFKAKFKSDRDGTKYKIAKYLIEKYHVKTISGKKLREIFVYQNGIYVPGEDQLKKNIQEILEEICTIHYSKEIIEIIKNLTVTDRTEFNVDKNLINLNNGVLDVRTLELISHSPDYFFFHKIPASYTNEADCPMIKKFLSEILDDESIPVIQEWFGYILYRSYFIKKAIIFVGERDTGKTTLLRLKERFVGKINVSGVDLQKISYDKFASAHFYNKHVNIYDDLSFKDINDNGRFKIATGGGSITGEFKFGDQFQFENYAKLTFACNKIPDVKDQNDEAYFGRWIIINFRNQIARTDKFLVDKLTTPEELSGLLNFALEGLKRLLKNEEFSYKKEPHEIRIEMQRSGSVIAQFAHNCLKEVTGQWIGKDAMYEAFVRYARSEELPIDTKEKFGQKIRNYASYLIDSKHLQLNQLTGKKVQITGWRNVEISELKNQDDEDQPNQSLA